MPLRRVTVSRLLGAALLTLLPVASRAQVGSAAATATAEGHTAVDLLPAPAAQAPALQFGVSEFPAARPVPSTSVGLRAVWDRLPVVRPFLGAGLAFGGDEPDPRAPSETPFATTPWLGGGVDIDLRHGATLGCGARLTGEDGAAGGSSRRKGREAGIRLTVPW